MNYEEFVELARSRRSVRRFTARRISHQQIEKLIEAACWAPSNHNRQGWRFVVFEDAEKIRTLAERSRRCIEAALTETRGPAAMMKELIHFGGGFEHASVVILVMHKSSPAVGKSILTQATSELASGEALSAAMACQNLLLGAHAAGLGTCLMTAPLLAGEVWKAVEGLPAGFTPTCLIAVGYPDESPPTPKRKKLEHVLEYR